MSVTYPVSAGAERRADRAGLHREDHAVRVGTIGPWNRGRPVVRLGTRADAIAGFLLGSVGQQVLARANSPVVMVRANARSAARHDGGEVVVGLDDLGDPAAPLLEFAFDAAAARRTSLRAVHAPNLPPLYGHGPLVGQLATQEGGITGQAKKALADALTPWREKYPQVPVAHTVDLARPSGVVLRAAAQAGLMVVGRRVHRPALGMRIGPVAHAVLHHLAAPVAVVPHD